MEGLYTLPSSPASSSSFLGRFIGRVASPFASPAASSSLSTTSAADRAPFFLALPFFDLGAVSSDLALGSFFAFVVLGFDLFPESSKRLRFLLQGFASSSSSSSPSSSSSIEAFLFSSSNSCCSCSRRASHSVGSSAVLYASMTSPLFLDGSRMYASISCFNSLDMSLATCHALWRISKAQYPGPWRRDNVFTDWSPPV